ncbi:MAG: electron transport complex subunit RsxC [Clostridia bacterium]|nr:electron transport complex subunit RsxC [Clostridia bacterium]
MAFYLKGAKVPHKKSTSGMSAIRIDAPKTVTIPTVMHIGAPATPVVKAGDSVQVGTLIAEQNGVISSPIYSSVSGTVKSVAEVLLSSGKNVPAITIESDGEMTVNSEIKPPVVNSREDLVNAVKQSGIVGLGGAGFPTYVKYGADKPLDIQELIINGAECEPYITSDSVNMIDNAEDIAFAIDNLVKYLNIKKVIIGIEKNKPKAIESMNKIADSRENVQVKVLPTLYPQGAEKVLVYHTTGKTIALGKLPIDVGCVVNNVTTIAAIGRYLKTGMPLVEKCITVDGSAVKEPKNVIVPIGTALKDVFEFCGGFKAEPKKVLYGGPMMGISVPDLDVPVLKNTNAVLAFAEKQVNSPKATACIRCGGCTNRCPFGIDPSAIARAYKKNDTEALEKLGVELCMECGCCTFACPAKRPLVQTNKLAKAALRVAKAKEAK